jgi:hypothetical protein
MLSSHNLRSTSPAREALLSVSTAPPGSHRAWLQVPGLRWCKHRDGRCGSRGRRRWPASNPASKQRAAQRSIPARRTSRLATASAHRVDAFRGHGQGLRRPGPVQQLRRRVWLPKEPPRASTCRRTPLGRRGTSRHNPNPPRRATICRPRPCCTDRSLGGEDWTVYQGPVSDPGQPPCHSKRTKIAVITSRSSGTE